MHSGSGRIDERFKLFGHHKFLSIYLSLSAGLSSEKFTALCLAIGWPGEEVRGTDPTPASAKKKKGPTSIYLKRHRNPLLDRAFPSPFVAPW
jgi:hypothetical protein